MVGRISCSVVIPTYNRSKLLHQTLECLMRQTQQMESFEIIVVDDGSSDDSLDVVRYFDGGVEIRYIWKPDHGFRVAEARNYGVNLARGDIIIFVDCGVLVGKDFVHSHLLAHHQSSSRLAVIGYVYGFSDLDRTSTELGRALDAAHIDSFIQESYQTGIHLDSREVVYGRCDDNINNLTTPWCLFWTCNVSVSRAALIEVGIFDEAFKSWGGEDIELGYRLHLSGLKYMLSRAAAGVHYPHDKKQRSQLEAFGNYRYFSRKHNLTLPVITGMEMAGSHDSSVKTYWVTDII